MIISRFNQQLSFYLLACLISSFLISLFLLQVFAVLLTFMWLFEKITEKKKAVDLFGILILLYGLIRLISILFSEFPQESIQSLYKEALFYFAFFSMNFYMKVLNENLAKKIVYVFLIASVIVAVIGIIKFNLDFDYRASSFSSGYMAFSSYLLAGLSVIIFSVPLKDISLNWLIRGIGTSFILTGIIASLGRVNIAIAFLLLLSGIAVKKIRLKELAAVLILTALLSAISFYNNSYRVFEYRVNNPSLLSDRDIILKGAGELFSKFENPLFGYGPRSFHLIFPYTGELSDRRINSWHNDFIQLYFESGVFGFLALCLLIFIPLGLGFKFLFYKNSAPPNKKELISGIVVSVFALAAAALSSVFINSPVLSLVFASLLSAESAILYREGWLKEFKFSKLKFLEREKWKRKKKTISTN